MGAREGRRDYTATPLWKKLGIREGARVRVVGAPPGFLERLDPMPGSAEVVSRTRGRLDVVVLFVTTLRQLERSFGPLVSKIRDDGRLWVAWPKGSAGVQTDVTFARVQDAGLAAGLVDNKTAAIDATFQGLQFVHRLKDRGGR
jgi:hypothetical protein